MSHSPQDSSTKADPKPRDPQDPDKHPKGEVDYAEPQDEGGTVDPDRPAGSRNRSGKPPWEATAHKKEKEGSKGEK